MSNPKSEGSIEALLTLRGGMGGVGRERIAMLEAVAEQGSITGAARALGLSYKAVWDGVNAINNLLPQPALVGRTGGAGGGGAALTEEGRKLILAFRRLEEKLSRVSTALLEEGEEIHPDLLLWGIVLKTSARNAFRATVLELKREAVSVEVLLEVAGGHRLSAIITNDSADDLGLEPGREVVALIKASFVTLDADPCSGVNCFAGTVIKRVDGETSAEIVLDIGLGKTMTAVVDQARAVPVGSETYALFSPGQVILAVA